jgi:ubiquinone/menaquinone biosynthesis C-methylase UbiE
MKNSKHATQNIAKDYADRGDPNGWFEEFYAKAEGDIHQVYWADLKPNSLLLGWIAEHRNISDRNAITIGCGLGDDAEALAQHGYQVTAFDISPSAIAMCQQRFPDSPVEYLVADLFNIPVKWEKGFDLVYECNTIQILKGSSRVQAVNAIAGLIAPGGEVLVSCRSRETGDPTDTFPLALDRDEIDGFKRAGLFEAHFKAYDDDQEPPVPHFFAVYGRHR